MIGNLEILNNYEDKMHFQHLLFDKIMLLCINRRLLAIFSKKISGRFLNGWHIVQILIQLQSNGRFGNSDYKNRQFFGKI